MTSEESTYSEMLLRWLAAKRDFPGLEIGPEPECPTFQTGKGFKIDVIRYSTYWNRKFWTREFNRTIE